MFFWHMSTFLNDLKRFLPTTPEAFESLAGAIGTRQYKRKLRAIYPRLDNISVDYALLEPASRQPGPPHVFVIPAEIGWSDIGSWAGVHGLLVNSNSADQNVFVSPGCALDASGNLISCPGKFTAIVGARELTIVATPDALLVCRRDRAQDVGKVVKWLEEQRRKELL